MVRGSCLCGAIRIEVQGAFEHPPEACHCSQCRKHSGHFLAAVNVRKSALTVHGEEQVAWFQSSEQVQRGFCKTCGSTLFWQPLMADYEWTAVAMGLFDDPVTDAIAKHTFVGDKGHYYKIEGEAEQSEAY